ncbi:zinc-binding dehydrogenase [Lederbergia sp. NSJ-179]|uniref:zinc-binding dehydrogenase n=1 Tax=Lederbergia sp. NSJ-179 TaxID=2931402 RepID=UPI001FD3D97E|nr:zinc-binding dehydrogenase [Lederbergia sp. NSJ-179]MCJ7843599.1 zinc-binding dehydrogenase [Lederbergia sp. NSJ-179]
MAKETMKAILVNKYGGNEGVTYERVEKPVPIVNDIDLVIDTVGGDTQERSWSILKQGGRLVSLVQFPSQQKAEEHGVTATLASNLPTPEDIMKLGELMANDIIKAAIDRIYPLNEAPEAMNQSEHRHGRGRILLSVHSDSK